MPLDFIKDFDKLHQLSIDDPSAFSALVQKEITDFVQTLPADRQERAKQIQWRLDHTLAKYKDPTARLNKMIEIFWEGVDEFRTVLNSNETPTPDNTSSDNDPAISNILPFNSSPHK